MNEKKPTIAIVSSTKTKIGAVLLYETSLRLNCDASIVIVDQDGSIESISAADKVIYRLGPESYDKFAKLVGLLSGTARLELDRVLASFDKIKANDILSVAAIPTPKTWIVDRGYKYPGTQFVIKIAKGNKGEGVGLINSQTDLEVFLSRYANDNKFIVQEFIAEARSSDKRLFVVGDKVVAAMKRQSVSDDFRSNLHLGAQAKTYDPTPEEQDIAVRSLKAFGLSYAGVDIIDSNRGPLVLEVNPSPGFGISIITGVDTAGELIKNIAGETYD